MMIFFSLSVIVSFQSEPDHMVEALNTAMSDLTIIEGNDGGNASLELLANLGVPFTNYAHELATTVEEQFKHVGHLPGALTKNLLLKVSIRGW